MDLWHGGYYQARAWPGNPLDHHYRFAAWLLYRASPAELRDIADALELESADIDPRRKHIIEAYMEALEESDPQFRWRDGVEFEVQGKRVMASKIMTDSPLLFKEAIKSPPTWKQFKTAFVRLFGEQCLPEAYSVRKTLTKLYELPLAESKRGRRPKK